jgi:hypothetical protein
MHTDITILYGLFEVHQTGCRLMVGQLPLEQYVGVQILSSQPL